MSEKLPAITGDEVIKLLVKDGWKEGRRTTHGVALTKKFADKTRVTIVPTHRGSIPAGTLHAILGLKQTNLGRGGLLELLHRE